MKKNLRIHTATAGDMLRAAHNCWGREDVVAAFARVRQGDPKAEFTLLDTLILAASNAQFKKADGSTYNGATIRGYIKNAYQANPNLFSPDMTTDDWEAIYSAVSKKNGGKYEGATADMIQVALSELFTFEPVTR